MTHEPLTRESAAADQLDTSAMALAAYAADQLLNGDPNADVATPNEQFHWWQSYLASRLRDLAAAVHLGRPRLFITQVRWCHDALTAKHVETDSFRQALLALAGVVQTEIPGPGAQIAQRYIRAAVEQLPDTPAELPSALDTDTDTGRLAAMYVLAILEGDRRRAIRLIHDAVADGLNIQSAYLTVLLPASHEIGQMWHRDELSIAEEHFATATTLMLMSQLLARDTPQTPNGKTVIVASVTGDRHTLGLHVVSDFFEMDGWRVIYLGADVPGKDLVQAVIDFRADLLVLAATLHTQLRTMEQLIRGVRQATEDKPVPVLVGGNAFSGQADVAKQIDADGFAPDIQGAVVRGRELVGLREGA